jgi:hypothetical protein
MRDIDPELTGLRVNLCDHDAHRYLPHGGGGTRRLNVSIRTFRSASGCDEASVCHGYIQATSLGILSASGELPRGGHRLGHRDGD